MQNGIWQDTFWVLCDPKELPSVTPVLHLWTSSPQKMYLNDLSIIFICSSKFALVLSNSWIFSSSDFLESCIRWLKQTQLLVKQKKNKLGGGSTSWNFFFTFFFTNFFYRIVERIKTLPWKTFKLLGLIVFKNQFSHLGVHLHENIIHFCFNSTHFFHRSFKFPIARKFRTFFFVRITR